MDELPELALIELFNSLPVYDQLKIRGVCKRWKAIIESNLSGRKELVIFYRSGTRPLFWFHSDSPVNLSSSFNVNEKFEKSPLFERLFKSIKRLYLICRAKDLLKNNFINFTNRFRHLEHLQVDTLADPSITALLPKKLKIRFNLPNLKSFCFNSKECPIGLVQLDCPKLEKLSVLYHFRLGEKCASFRESLKFLRVASFECKPGFELPSLEVLCCQNVLPIDISAHQKLKEIHYFYEPFDYTNGIYLPNRVPNYGTVLKGILEQKRRLGRSELPIYFQGIRCSSLGPPEMRPAGGCRTHLRKSDLNLLLQNSEDLQFSHQHWTIRYESELDEEIAAFDAEQSEKLARCLTEVELGETLSTNPALNVNLKILFTYVQRLWISKEEDFRTQRNLDRLPDLFPHLVEFEQDRVCGIYLSQALRNPSAYPDEFGEGPLNFRFLARFKALQKLKTDKWRISASELNEIVKSCRFLEEIELHSLKWKELANGQVRTTLASIWIGLFDNQLRTNAYEYEYLISDGKDTEKIGERRNPRGTFQSSEVAVDWLNQRGYLRKETQQR